MAKKILIIDDDREYGASVSMLLEANGYVPICTYDGEEGFVAARSEQPALILLDVMMQHVSEGLDLAVKLRDDPATAAIPVILVTGIKKPQYLTFSFRPGEEWPNVKGILEKPAKPQELLARIAAALA